MLDVRYGFDVATISPDRAYNLRAQNAPKNQPTQIWELENVEQGFMLAEMIADFPAKI